MSNESTEKYPARDTRFSKDECTAREREREARETERSREQDKEGKRHMVRVGVHSQ